MNRIFILLFLVLLSACGINRHKQLSSEQLIRQQYVSSVDNKSHDYLVFLPRGYADNPQKKWPVMLFLHGNGERGNGLDELDYVLKNGPVYEAWIQKKDIPFIIISPQLPMFGMEKVPYIVNRTRSQIPVRLRDGVPPRETPFATPQMMLPAEDVRDLSSVAPLLPMGWEQVEKDLLSMITDVQQKFNGDTRHTVITGLSYGGYGTWFMASKYPHLFSAVVHVVGWGHPDLMAPLAKAELPVWVFAGGRDAAVAKKYFYAGINKLEELGNAELRFTVHEDMGHDAWTRVYSSDDLYNWLLQQKK
jgi:predicted peptidase